jgi:hypothetical protein
MLARMAPGLLKAGWRIVSGLIRRSHREWAQWAVAEPLAAATQLESISNVLRFRADARRWQWLADRDRAVATALRHQADELRARAGDASSLERLCSVRPGTFARAS